MTKLRGTRAARWVALLVPFALIAGACGSDDNSSGSPTTVEGAAKVDCATGSILGAGATFPNAIVQQWEKDYAAACSGASINYNPVGSGAGIQQFIAGTTQFAGSDVAMKPEEQTAAEAKWGGPIVHIPWSAGGIALEYNLSSVNDLKLTPDAVAGIFAGTITKWDDPAIKATNADASLPSQGIQVVHRSDGSGTTAAFTSYLTAAAPSVWTLGAGKEVAWTAGQGAKGSDGVTAAVKQAEGAIGYAELSYAKGAGLAVASIKNPAGQFTAPDSAAVSASLASATVPDDLKVKINYLPPTPDAYPISTVTFVILPAKPADAGVAKLLRSFVLYAVGPGQAAADALHYSPLPAPVAAKAQAAADKIGT